jgi:hypothetical protein
LRKILFPLFIVLNLSGVFSQAIRNPVAARYIGMGAYSMFHIDVFSFTANQAALAQVKSIGCGVYGEKRFLLSELNMYTLVMALPTPQGNFGIQADYFGFKNYNESQLGLAYARSLGAKLDIGIKFNYYGVRIPGYSNSATVNFELGAIAHLSPKLCAGIHIYNPAGGKLSKEGDKLSSAYKFGIGYEASQAFLVSAEIVKVEDQVVNVNAGFQYNFQKQFFVRAGIATETTNSYAGAGVSWKNLRIDISGSYHPQLGITPGLMVIINSNPAKK